MKLAATPLETRNAIETRQGLETKRKRLAMSGQGPCPSNTYERSQKMRENQSFFICTGAFKQFARRLEHAFGALQNLSSSLLAPDYLDHVIEEIEKTNLESNSSLSEVWNRFFQSNYPGSFLYSPQRGVYNPLPFNTEEIRFMDLSQASLSSVSLLPSRLTVLNISSNHLRELPDELLSLSLLRVLDVSNNCLQGQLPSKRGNNATLPQLKVLDVSNNPDLSSLGIFENRENLLKRVHGTQIVSALPSQRGSLFTKAILEQTLPRTALESWEHLNTLWCSFVKLSSLRYFHSDFSISKPIWKSMCELPGFLDWVEQLLYLCTSSHFPLEVFPSILQALYFISTSPFAEHFNDFTEDSTDQESAMIKLMEILSSSEFINKINTRAQSVFYHCDEYLDAENEWFAFKDRKANGFSIWSFDEFQQADIHVSVLRYIKLQTFFGIFRKYMEACSREASLQEVKFQLFTSLLSELGLCFPWQRWFSQTQSMKNFCSGHPLYCNMKSELLDRDLLIVYIKSLPEKSFLKKVVRAYLWSAHRSKPSERAQQIQTIRRKSSKEFNISQPFKEERLFQEYGSDYTALFDKSFFKDHTKASAELTQIAEAVYLNKLIQKEEEARLEEDKIKEQIRRRASFLRKDVLNS